MAKRAASTASYEDALLNLDILKCVSRYLGIGDVRSLRLVNKTAASALLPEVIHRNQTNYNIALLFLVAHTANWARESEDNIDEPVQALMDAANPHIGRHYSDWDINWTDILTFPGVDSQGRQREIFEIIAESIQ